MSRPINLWSESDHVERYLAAADSIPHRTEGERVVLELLQALQPGPTRVLDLGCGDGRLMGLVRVAFPGCGGIACDFSDAMLDAATARFTADDRVEVRRHDLDDPLDCSWGEFDAVVSSFAIHHLVDERKRELYREVLRRLRPGGRFINLEHVASPTDRLHNEFLAAIGTTPEGDDPSNKLVDVATQVTWLSELGFEDADCYWKWRELALISGTAPSTPLR